MLDLINNLPTDLGRKGAKFTTVSMLKEGFNIYLSYEQDPYWGVKSLVEYIIDEEVPIPDDILSKMQEIAEGETKKRLKEIENSSWRKFSLKNHIATLVKINKKIADNPTHQQKNN
ncbi:hypothetical protein [Zooshikella harenae]|uniref:Uncharacterized protein n=1 Tax=Zooshikella harenae TaxID=2827238 RepID=A0ABS5ZI85_9GAMM|nr:hypothetical protein [Zooshikella harenae]MBU2713779.1 hypothetical protein [Zooshikella harenae]